MGEKNPKVELRLPSEAGEMRVGLEGDLCEQKYKIGLSEEYEGMFYQGMRANRNLAFHMAGVHGAEFPAIVDKLREINLDNASVNDIGMLVKYFGFNNRTMEEITDNLKYERI